MKKNVCEDKGFDFGKLPPRTKIILKTKNSSYELELIENQKAMIVGGRLPNQSLRFSIPTLISPVGSTKTGSLIGKENWIGIGMNFEFIVDQTQQLIITSEIHDAEICKFVTP